MSAVEVIIIVRATVHNEAVLMAAARASLLRDGHTPEDAADASAHWTSAEALAELIAEGVNRIPHDDAAPGSYPEARDIGVSLDDLEIS